MSYFVDRIFHEWFESLKKVRRYISSTSAYTNSAPAKYRGFLLAASFALWGKDNKVGIRIGFVTKFIIRHDQR